jgi:hypothetical protein
MKKSLLALVAMSVMAFAVDYSAMSATELAAMRGTVATEDQAAFKAAMQSKMQALSSDERAAINGAGAGAGAGTGNKGANAAGSGAGTGGGAGKGGGNGNGGRGGRQ